MRLTEVFAQFWPNLRPLRGWLVLGLVLLAVAPLIAVLEILLFQRLVDDVLVPADFGPLMYIAAAYIGLNIASAVVSGADDYLSTWVSQRFLVALRTDTFRHVLSLPLHVHEHRRLGDVLSRLTSDIGSVEAFMVRYAPQWVKVRETIASGRIGDVHGMQAHVTYRNMDAANIRNRPEVGGGALMDIGCYAILFARLVERRRDRAALTLGS